LVARSDSQLSSRTRTTTIETTGVILMAAPRRP
jgi:hypothetical protein